MQGGEGRSRERVYIYIYILYIYVYVYIYIYILPAVQAGFRKGRGTRDQIANIHWVTEKAREFKKNIYFCFIDYTKAFDCVDHNKLWKILNEMGIPDHLTCLLRNLNVGQEATVRTRHGKMNWFQIGKGVCQGSILSPCLFNFYAEYIMWTAGLDEAQARIKISRRNINNLRYADDTTLMTESEVCHCFYYFPIYLSGSDGTGCHDLGFLNVEF